MSEAENNNSRRQFLTLAGATALTGVAAQTFAAAKMGVSEANVIEASLSEVRHLFPSGKTYTPNGWTLPYKMNGGVKEFHLIAEPVEHEFAPGSVAKLWGYNGSAPGPTIEAVEGD